MDSGVNYLLPAIASRLARDADGAALGYDWWDMDPRPLDQDPSRSAFFPRRHGTRTASLLLEEAPLARLIPYRYPRADMSRMAAAAILGRCGIALRKASVGCLSCPERLRYFTAETAQALVAARQTSSSRELAARAVEPSLSPAMVMGPV